MCPIRQLPTGQIDLGVLRVDRESLTTRVDPDELSLFRAELAVAIAKANLPVAFRRVSRCDEQLCVVFIQRIHERLGSVTRTFLRFRRLAGQFANHLASIEFAIPDPFVTQ